MVHNMSLIVAFHSILTPDGNYRYHENTCLKTVTVPVCNLMVRPNYHKLYFTILKYNEFLSVVSCAFHFFTKLYELLVLRSFE
jgi:hypothetical protein